MLGHLKKSTEMGSMLLYLEVASCCFGVAVSSDRADVAYLMRKRSGRGSDVGRVLTFSERTQAL